MLAFASIVLAPIMLAVLLAPAAQAQDGEAPPGPQQNAVSVLAARGDSLFLGPCLDLLVEGERFEALVRSERLCGDSPNAVSALDAEGAGVVAGLQRPSPSGSAAAGFFFSSNGGASFAYAGPQLDGGTQDDATVRYGVNAGPAALPALPVVVPEGSAPLAVDYVDATGTIWVAGGASGLRRSSDGAETFERVVLPPDSLSAISPTERYAFALRPLRGGRGERNHVATSVLVDEAGVVWAGTPAGLNRSRPEDVVRFEDAATGAPFTDRSWRRFDFGNTSPDAQPAPAEPRGEGLAGSFVSLLREQPLEGQRNPVWVVTQPTAFVGSRQETRALTYTPDGGATFFQTLPGERVYDLAFRGRTVYVASRRGLFVAEGPPATGDSSAAAYEWRLIDTFPGADRPEPAVATRPLILSVATTEDRLYAGTRDGLLASTDGGATWRVYRTRVPVDPAEPTEAVPDVETFAYPNPFSPFASASGVVRIVAEAGGDARRATVEIYDFAMDFVREVSGGCDADGRCEVPWDGLDAGGARVANGVYFYQIEAGGRTARGKIVVLE